MEANYKMKNIPGKNGLLKIIETWQQYCTLKKTQDEAYHVVALATILAPVSFSFEPNITICNSTAKERRTYRKHTQCPYCA